MKLSIKILVLSTLVIGCKTQAVIKSVKHQSDDQLMQKLVYQEKYEAAFIDDSTLTMHQLDSVLSEEHTSVEAGEVIYDKDSTIKALNVYTEYCGAYCNYEYNKFLFTSRNTPIKLPENLISTAIYKIYKLDNQQYLLLSEGGARPAGFYTIAILEANLFQLEGDSLRPIVFDTTTNSGGIDIYSEHFVEEEMFVKYAETTKTLSYQYGQLDDIYTGESVGHFYAGSYQYEGGIFKETERVKKPKLYEYE